MSFLGLPCCCSSSREKSFDGEYSYIFEQELVTKQLILGEVYIVCEMEYFHELIIQIGNRDDTGSGTEIGEQAKAALDEYYQGFRERNPRQIDDLVAQAREAQQAKRRQRQRSYDYER